MEFGGEEFLEKYKEDQFYVAFLKGKKGWFPICLASSAEEGGGEESPEALDKLCVSDDRAKIEGLAEYLKENVPAAEAIEILYLFPVEIRNLLERYGIKKIEYINR